VRAPGDRERRARGRHQHAGRRPQDAGAAIIAELEKQGADDIIVFVGGVIPQQDYEFLYNAGVKGIYGPGTPIPASAKDVLEQIRAPSPDWGQNPIKCSPQTRTITISRVRRNAAPSPRRSRCWNRRAPTTARRPTSC
jgi:predicted Fe-Mo cluster-binding NifX family protein